MSFPLLVILLSTLQLIAVYPLPTAYFFARRQIQTCGFFYFIPFRFKNYSAIICYENRYMEGNSKYLLHFFLGNPQKKKKKQGGFQTPMVTKLTGIHTFLNFWQFMVSLFLVLHFLSFNGRITQQKKNFLLYRIFCCTNKLYIIWERLIDS